MKNNPLLIVISLATLIVGCKSSSHTSNENSRADDVREQNLKKIDIQALQTGLEMEGEEKEGQFKITFPQNDLNVVVDGFRIIPPMGLGSWVAFTPTSDETMIMGDIVVTESDLKPVQQVIIEQGLTITAIHNHFVRNNPDVMYMHIGGSGNEKELARKVRAVFDKVSEIRGGNPADAGINIVENTLDTLMLDRILGHSGKMNNGVYKFTIGRPDVVLKEHGTPITTFLGFNTWASWQGSSERAAVAGDFTMLADEVGPVIKALVENDIEVVALHNHMVHEEPRVFFLHYWGVGPAEKLAKGLKAALDQTGKQNREAGEH